MAANIFGRYVWLVDTLLHHGRLTLEQINALWKQCRLSYGESDELAAATFHRHRQAIRDIFDIDIACDTRGGYTYYIDHPEKIADDRLRSWLVDSFSALNQLQADCKLSGRILFEDIPSGHRWLAAITQAMRTNRVIGLTHQGFGKPEPTWFEVEPYYLKVVCRRWYVIGRSPYYSMLNREAGREPADVFRAYALDRISDVELTERTFEMNPDFDADRFFSGCCGVITSDEPPVRVVVRAYDQAADYLRTLPLHISQREISANAQEACFEYMVKPTLDFYGLLLSQGDQIEVLEPESVREEMRAYAESLLGYYARE